MDKILSLLRGLKADSKDDGDRRSTERSKTRSRDLRNSQNRHQDKEVDAVVAMLASGLMSYALRQYATSNHNHKRRKRGGVDIDFVLLEQIGQKILEKLIEATSSHLKSQKEKRSLAADADKKRKRQQEDDSREHRHDRHHKKHEYSESEAVERRRRRRRHTRRDTEEAKPKSRRDSTPKITITPPTVSSDSSLSQSSDHRGERRRQRRTSPVRHEKPLSSTAHQRPSSEAEERKPSRGTPDLGSLRAKVVELSTAIIELSARSSAGIGGKHHAECEFYDKFVEKSGPVQDAIGGVLGQIRELEEAEDGARRYQQRRRRG